MSLKTIFCENGFNGTDVTVGTNVGFRKPANQSTTVRGGNANHGNDGDFSTEHDGKRCTETQSEPSPWWRVDLLKPYSVKVVRVTTRGCCGKSLHYYYSQSRLKKSLVMFRDSYIIVFKVFYLHRFFSSRTDEEVAILY